MKKGLLALSAIVAFVVPATTQARDTQHFYDFHLVVEEALADGALDGTVKFYLMGEKIPGKVTQTFPEAVSDRKTGKKGTTGAGKDGDQARCDWALRAALLSFQDNAKKNGANAVIDLVSYYKEVEYQDVSKYECHAGKFMVGAALKGKAAIVR
ncbi:MAG: hypothetical protein LBI92_10790 [Azoarcus sp.]|nr:hypothetical protein [Azoarcus sp.]